MNEQNQVEVLNPTEKDITIEFEGQEHTFYAGQKVILNWNDLKELPVLLKEMVSAGLRVIELNEVNYE